MSDYVALPQISGLLSGFVGVDREALTFAGGRTVQGFQIGLLDADAAGDTIVELRTVAGGSGGQFMQLTIPAGANVPVVTTPTGDAPFNVVADDKLFLRVTQSPPTAIGLYGVLELNSIGPGAVVNPAGAQDLTTDSIVLEYMPQASAMTQALRDQVRLGVSQRMVKWMGREYVHPQSATTSTYRISTGIESRMALNEWPATALVITIDGGDPLDVSDFRVESDRVIRYLGGGNRPSLWPVGDVEFTGEFGYPASPEALVHAATWQTCAELRRIELRQIGVSQHSSQAGPVETMNEDGWLPSVLQAMAPFRRML